MSNSKHKVALLINTISPARLPVYAGLAEHFDLLILHGGTESNRDSWRDMEKALPNGRIKRAWGWQVRVPRIEKGRPFDRRFIHVTPGYVQHLLAFRPEALISNEMGLRTVLALAYGTLFRKPVWVWWGGTLHTERKTGLRRRALRAIIRLWTRHWISYGETSTEYLRSLGISGDRVLQIQNAVDERLFSPDGIRALAVRPRPVLLHVGQLIGRKGVDLLLNAAAALQKEGLAFSLLLVGSGPEKPALQRIVRGLGLKHVHFIPSQKPDEMPAFYRSADVLVFPTLEDVWGLVANEAMLCGLSVLCSKYAGCAAELFPAQNIFDPENPNEFKNALRRAVSGELAKPDCSRLKSAPEILDQMIRSLEASMSVSISGPSASSPERISQL